MNTSNPALPILAAIRRFVCQRPGFEPVNYWGAPQAYRADSSKATRQRVDALAMLARLDAAAEYDGPRIAALILEEGKRGRFTVTRTDSGAIRCDYCAGQYWCTEYRAGACRLLASVLWDRQRESMADPDGDALRACFRRMFGRGIASRWFH